MARFTAGSMWRDVPVAGAAGVLAGEDAVGAPCNLNLNAARIVVFLI